VFARLTPFQREPFPPPAAPAPPETVVEIQFQSVLFRTLIKGRYWKLVGVQEVPGKGSCMTNGPVATAGPTKTSEAVGWAMPRVGERPRVTFQVVEVPTWESSLTSSPSTQAL